MSIYAETVGI